MRTIGIDIGSFSIKVAEIETSPRGHTLKNFFELELPHEHGGDIRFQTVELLKQVIAQYDINSVRTVVSIGAEHVASRVLEFPFLERRKILQSLPFELEDNIPFSQEESIFDFRVIGQRQKSSQILAMAVPKKYIQEVLALCDDAGFDPDVITPDALAITNHFASELPPAPITTEPGGLTESGIFSHAEVFLHLGYKKTLFNVTRNGGLLASRTIYFGGYDLAMGLSRAYELPFLDALKAANEKAFLLTTPDGADPAQQQFGQVVAQSIEPLLTDVKRSVLDLKSQFKLNFTQCSISGGISGILNLGPYVSKEISIPTTIKNPPPRSPDAITMMSEVRFSPQSERIGAVAVGLALEAVRKPKSPTVNFRKNEFSKESKNIKVFFENNKNLILSGLFVFIAFFVYAMLRGGLIQDNLNSLDQVMADQAKNNTIGLTKANTKTEALKRFIKSKKDELEGRKEVSKLNQTSSALEVLKNISSAIPSKDQIKLDLRNFQIADDLVTMAGMVSNVNEFTLLQRKVAQMPTVTGVKASPFPAPQGKYGFQLSFNLKRNKAKEVK